MTDAERREAARRFYQKWVNRGKEDEDDRSYWIDFLQNIMGMDHVTDRIDFQKKVVGPDGNTKRIDAYIPETRVLIEQKSLNIDLSKPQNGHGGMTPYEQAKMYDNSLPVSEKAKWIIISNFAEIWVYDMDTRVPEPKKFTLAEIPNKYPVFDFLIDREQEKLSEEMEISVKAGEFVGLIYDALLKQYIDPTNADSLKSLNMLCVRLVFCLYAEDAHIFHDTNGHIFHDYMEQFETKDMRKALIELFKTLDTPSDMRDKYDTSMLSQFPYVNGGLFAEENIEIPNFTDEIRNVLLSKASEGFDWSKISPTIFGAVFESTLNPETRRSGGMHYTSIENIHKVIDPLFLNDLKSEFEEIKSIQIAKTRTDRLRKYQDKISAIRWLDPACGSGNFLTETYLSVRRLENQVIYELEAARKDSMAGQISFGDVTNPIKVSIQQFYGIEINDFAVTVAKTALWIAESQMLKETEDIIRMSLDFLPLKTNANIIEDNALRIDWETIIPKNMLSYIIGNPPFVGFRWATDQQKNDLDYALRNSIKRSKLDFITGWFYKAAEYIQGTKTKVAFVSTNSITQGEHVAVFWDYLLNEFKIVINFAYTTFVWKNEASDQAHVHCVIIGFSTEKCENTVLYVNDEPKQVETISPYLSESPAVIINKQTSPICNVPALVPGCQASDGGAFMFTPEERNELLLSEPNSEYMLKRFMMGYEFLNNVERYCIWIPDKELIELDDHPIIKERIKKVADFRKKSTNKQIREKSNTPTRFDQFRPPTKQYIAFARVSSQKRRYIPVGFLTDEVIPGDKLFTIPNGTVYMFGILSSNVHAAWLRVTGGRLKSDYSYSSQMVYNTFPWPEANAIQKQKIEETAQHILDVRKIYENRYSLAKMYDPDSMPSDLRKAHTENDRAVMQAYGFNIKDMSEADCVTELMRMYQELVST